MKRAKVFWSQWTWVLLLAALACACQTEHSLKRKRINKIPSSENIHCTINVHFEFEQGGADQKKFYQLYVKDTRLSKLSSVRYQMPVAQITFIRKTESDRFRREMQEAIDDRLKGKSLTFRPKQAAFDTNTHPNELELSAVIITPTKPAEFEEINAVINGVIDAYNKSLGQAEKSLEVPKKYQRDRYIPAIMIANESQLRSLGWIGDAAKLERREALIEINAKLAAFPSKYGMKLIFSSCH